MLAEIGWLDPIGLANSATFLNQADDALRWAANQEWRKRVQEEDDDHHLRSRRLPREISRRIVRAIIMKLETEGKGADLRGAEIERVMDALAAGKQVDPSRRAVRGRQGLALRQGARAPPRCK